MKEVEFVVNENNYSAPLVEIVEVEVETGFSVSGGLDDYIEDDDDIIV